MNILSICIFLVTYGRMIEIYTVTALGPIPLATLGNAEWRGMGQNYLKSLLALGFQAFLIMVCRRHLCGADTGNRDGGGYFRRDLGLHGLHSAFVLLPVQDGKHQ